MFFNLKEILSIECIIYLIASLAHGIEKATINSFISIYWKKKESKEILYMFYFLLDVSPRFLFILQWNILNFFFRFIKCFIFLLFFHLSEVLFIVLIRIFLGKLE